MTLVSQEFIGNEVSKNFRLVDVLLHRRWSVLAEANSVRYVRRQSTTGVGDQNGVHEATMYDMFLRCGSAGRKPVGVKLRASECLLLSWRNHTRREVPTPSL